MFKVLKKSKNPKFVIVTPLKVGDKIHTQTKKSIRRNDTEFDWVTYEGHNNIPVNTELGLYCYDQEFQKIQYMIKIDNDIYMDNNLLDDMYHTIINADDNVGYVYCPFTYIAYDGAEMLFDYPFNKKKLLDSNYISSNSMINRNMLEEIGGFVVDNKYVRLLDWCLWLKMLKHGYIGQRISSDKSFTTPLVEGNVSSRGFDDYVIKRDRVIEDFINI